ncbi:hypothetical protein HYY75_01675, partial [bacterium]|nr:hypothetical protein [bacterium]
MIRIIKARVHNLKNLSVSIPRGTLTVITGVSGSGKSSLAFDTIHAEGQRRYIESLSTYARQFLQQMEKPDVESIEGLSPTIAIEQKSTSRNPRSTVGTITEIYDYFRLLFAAIGKPHCPKCNSAVTCSTPQQIVERLLQFPVCTKLSILSPVVRGRKGEYLKLFDEFKKEGFSRIRIDGVLYSLDDELPHLDPKKKHQIELVIDRLILSDEIEKSRLTDDVELALKLSEGFVSAILEKEKGAAQEEIIFNERLGCPRCEQSLPEIKPRLFSFNAPFGACPKCSGLGMQLIVDPDLIIPDRSLSLAEGAIAAVGAGEETFLRQRLVSLAKHFKFSLSTPVKELPPKIVQIILNGSGCKEIETLYEGKKMQAIFKKPFEGLIPTIERRFRET